MRSIFRLLLLFFILSSNLWADNSPSSWYSKQPDRQVFIHVDLFLTSSCDHCHKADAFFLEIEKNAPWLQVSRHLIDKDRNALIQLKKLSAGQAQTEFAVPSIFFCNSRWVGFATAQTTGQDLMQGLHYCKQQIEKKGDLTSADMDTLQAWANTYLLKLATQDLISSKSLMNPLLLLPLVDAVNPCALFFIGTFFAFLLLQDTRKKQLQMGLLIFFTAGGLHFIQQVYTNTFFALLPSLRWPAALVGIFSFYMLKQYNKERVKNYISFLWVFLLMVLVWAYQQTCLVNWSYVFQDWLNKADLTNGMKGLYQLIFQSLYLLPLLLSLILYLVLIKRKTLVKLKQPLRTVSYFYISIVALFLIIYPEGLSSIFWSYLILLSMSIVLWRKKRAMQKLLNST